MYRDILQWLGKLPSEEEIRTLFQVVSNQGFAAYDREEAIVAWCRNAAKEIDERTQMQSAAAYESICASRLSGGSEGHTREMLSMERKEKQMLRRTLDSLLRKTHQKNGKVLHAMAP